MSTMRVGRLCWPGAGTRAVQALGAAPQPLAVACRASICRRAPAPVPALHRGQQQAALLLRRQQIGGGGSSGQQRGSIATRALLSSETLVGLAIFFSPSVAALIYAYVLGKGNLTDGLSRLLTVVSQVGAGAQCGCRWGLLWQAGRQAGRAGPRHTQGLIRGPS